MSDKVYVFGTGMIKFGKYLKKSIKNLTGEALELTQKDFEQHIFGCLPGHTLDIIFPFLNADERQAMFTDLALYEANLTYQPVEGTLELLHSLREHNVPTALVTSGDRAKVKEVASQLELDGLFTVTVTAEDVEQGKPYPDCQRELAGHRATVHTDERGRDRPERAAATGSHQRLRVFRWSGYGNCCQLGSRGANF